jgi:cyclase
MNHRIMARLDIKGPNLVKGVHLEGLRVLGEPERFAKYYYENGIDELVYMDVVASLYNRNSLHDIISKTAKDIFIPLTVGGGLRTVDDMRKVLRAGADKVAINTAAIKNPEIIREAVRCFGSSTVVISIEAKKVTEGVYEAYVDNGREKTGLDVFQWARKVFDLGAGEILLTSIDQEGTGKGFDLHLVRKVSELVPIPVIASGGAGSKEHVKEVLSDGKADAVCVASLLHYDFLRRAPAAAHQQSWAPFEQNKSSRIQDVSIQDLKDHLMRQDIECRV